MLSSLSLWMVDGPAAPSFINIIIMIITTITIIILLLLVIFISQLVSYYYSGGFCNPPALVSPTASTPSPPPSPSQPNQSKADDRLPLSPVLPDKRQFFLCRCCQELAHGGNVGSL